MMYSVYHWTVENLQEQMEKGQLIVQPDYQRQRVWGPKANKHLIDSILRGYPIPEFYMNIPKDVSEAQYDVVDGQQRIGAILDFLNNKYPLGNFGVFSHESIGFSQDISGKKFKQLPDIVKARLIEYKLTINMFNSTDEDMAEIFSRVSNGVALNPAEKRHAMVDSWMRNHIKKTVKIHPFYRSMAKRIKDKRNRHQQVTDVIMRLCLENKPTSVSNANLTKMYKLYAESPPAKEALARFTRIMDWLDASFDENTYRTVYTTHALQSYVTILLLLSNDYELDDSIEEIGRTYERILHMANQNAKIPIAKRDARLSEVFHSSQGLIDAGHQWGRVKLFIDLITETVELKPKATKDKKRYFSDLERWELYMIAEKKCQKCDTPLPFNDMEAHHIKPHSEGGQTVIENGMALCGDCHREVHSSSNRQDTDKSNFVITPLPSWDDEEVKPSSSNQYQMKRRKKINLPQSQRRATGTD